MAVGVNVVGTDCPSGPGEILEGGKYGRLAKVNDRIDLAEKIELALNNLKPAELLKYRVQNFRNKNVVKEYLTLLK